MDAYFQNKSYEEALDLFAKMETKEGRKRISRTGHSLSIYSCQVKSVARLPSFASLMKKRRVKNEPQVNQAIRYSPESPYFAGAYHLVDEEHRENNLIYHS
ncbi:unnamed protein product [Eruca vesicaria subsp. sativa]|uniref:Pentatricopeptide repeat-containing protein n=1 Tax=Eruca vesicaria subsp. sativa TaxID=29727 RepID=A0ABC8J9M0_ERUVS|nr:unnamed protein product [Eruca vesicaria subsp. sativa]